MSEEPTRNGAVWAGLFGTLGLHLAASAAIAIVKPAFMESEIFGPQQSFWFFIGVCQLVYMVPAMLIAVISQKKALLKGFVIGTSVTFILNACCFGVVAAQA